MGERCPRCGSENIVRTVDWQDDICAECGESIEQIEA